MFIVVKEIYDTQHPEHSGDELDAPPAAPTELTRPTRVMTAHIRSWCARKNNAPGSRIVFANGIGMAVTDTPEELELLVRGSDV